MRSVIRALTVLLVIAMLIGCGGDNRDITNIPTSPALQANPTSPPVTTWPAGLPVDAVQPWEELDSNGKVLSATDASTDFFEGPQTHSESGDTSGWNGALRMASGDVGAGNLSYAMYRIPLGGAEPGVVSVDANLRPMGDGSIGGYWVGLADYGNNSWQWFGPVTDAHWRVSAVQAARESASFTSGVGSLFVCVVAHDGAAIDVVGVGVDPVDLGDTTAPDVPTGLVLTPVASGIEVAWTAVGGSDVAGYKVYYKNSAFGEHTAQFANTVAGLQGRSFVLGGQDKTWVAVSALDKSGNESVISIVESATPLEGAAPQVSIEITGYSVMRGEQVSLTATGADTYDWDTDGNGVFDILGDVTGTADVDTSQTGLIRPLVRGTGAESTSVALSAVSVIVSSNSRPVAVANVSPASGDAPHAVVFSGTESTDFDGSIVGGGWDFDGDGTYDLWDDIDIVHVTSSNHTYTTPGLYNAKLRVVDNEGAWDVDTVAVVAYAVDPSNDPPTADLQLTPAYGDAGDSFTLDASASTDNDGSIVNYEWDFDGDGAFDAYGLSPTIAHTYLVHGVFVALVRVTDNAGGRDTATADVRVNEVFDLDHPWGNFGHDLRNTRRSPYIGAQTNNLKWSYTTGGYVLSSPAIGADGTVYVGSGDNTLYALNPDGSLKWSYPTGGNKWSSPAIGADGAVYVGGGGTYTLNALNPDGSLKWSYTTGGTMWSSPAIGADGTVYVGSYDNKLHAINPDGSLKWSYTTGGDVYSSPAIGADGTVYVGSIQDNTLYALNPDGSLKWSYITGNSVYSSPAVGADGTVYIGSRDFRLHAINPDGSFKWSYNTPGGDVDSSPAIGADGTIYVGSVNDLLYALNPDGSLKWSYITGGNVSSSPAIGADGTMYVGSKDNKLYALNLDGSLKWSYFTGGEVLSSPAIGADGTVYVGSDDGKLYAFGVGNSPPTADLTATPPDCNMGETIRYDASGSTDINGTIDDYEWDLDDDGVYNEGGDEADNQGNSAVEQTYPNAGYNSVTVRVTDNDGATDTASVAITVHGWAGRTLDFAGDVGSYTSIAVVGNNPAISYYDATNGDLKFIRASNPSGSSWGIAVAVETDDNVGYYTSLAVVDGNPAIAYLDFTNADLMYVRATDAGGTSWGTPVALDTGGTVGEHISMAIVGGHPAISYFDTDNTNLKYVRATDASGSTWGAPQTIDSTNDVGLYTSLAIVDGNPAISYYDSTSGNLKYVWATDADGDTWDTPVNVDTGGDVGYDTSLAVVDGNPAIGYYGVTGTELRYVRATNANGSTWGTPVLIDTGGIVGIDPSLAIVDGNPALSYRDFTNTSLKYVRASNATGSNWNTPFTVVSDGSVGWYSSLLAVESNPAISYYDTTTDDLRFVRLY